MSASCSLVDSWCLCAMHIYCSSSTMSVSKTTVKDLTNSAWRFCLAPDDGRHNRRSSRTTRNDKLSSHGQSFGSAKGPRNPNKRRRIAAKSLALGGNRRKFMNVALSLNLDVSPNTEELKFTCFWHALGFCVASMTKKRKTTQNKATILSNVALAGQNKPSSV